MDTKLKRQMENDQTGPQKRTRPMEYDELEQLDEIANEDENTTTMFDILRMNHKVNLENLILNRTSFAQTVENLFALSVLVKAGRAEIKVEEDGCHLVFPRNAPSANAILSGEVKNSHFIFRLDFSDWKLMLKSVEIGEELMPHRIYEESNSQPNFQCEKSEGATTAEKVSKDNLVTSSASSN